MAVTTLCGILLVLSCKVFAEQPDKPQCNKPEEVYGNARLRTDLGKLEKFTDGFGVIYRCQPGFVTSSSLKRTCSNGAWTSIECIHRFCPDLDDPENGERLDTNSFVGNRTYFRCNRGYILKGASNLICRNDGEWRPSDPPVCEPVKCPQIPSISHGQPFQEVTDGQRNIFGRVVTFDCDPGFKLKGSKHRRCQANGTWSGVQPTCQVPSCPELPPLYNGVIYYNKKGLQSFGDVAEVECNEGTDLFPEDFDRYVVCEGFDTPQWTISNFTCEARHSVAPGDNMKLYIRDRNWWSRKRVMGPETFKSRTKLSAECDRNYEILLIFENKEKVYINKGNYDFRVFNGTVKPVFPICKEKRCSLEQCDRKCMYIGGYPPDGSVEHRVQVTKACREDYEFEVEKLRHRVNYTSTCDKGQISFPECIYKRCEIPTREKGDDIEIYSPGDLVHNGVTVKKSCSTTQELYNIDRKSYLGFDIFTSECNVGQWSKPDFPVCWNKRCTIPRFSGTKFMSKKFQVIAGSKVHYGTTLDIECVTGYENHGPSQARCDRGKLLEDAPCRPKSCHLPAIENSEQNKRRRTLDHGQTLNASCEPTHMLAKLEDRSSVGFVETKCLFGNLTVTLDGFICEPRGCSPLPNAECELLDNMGKPKSEWPSLFDHHQFASIKCNESFVLIRKEENKETRVNGTMTTHCVFGDWKPRYECRKDTCEFELPKKGYHDVNGRKQNGFAKIDSGTKGKIMCRKGYHLYSENRSESYPSYPLQCTGNEISVPKLICIRRCELIVNDGQYYTYLNGKVTEKKNIPSGEKVNVICAPNHTLFRDGIDVDRGFGVQKCSNGKLRPMYECKLKVDEKKEVDGEIVTTANASTEVIPKVTSDRLLTITTLQMTTPAKSPTVPTTTGSFEDDISNGDDYDYDEQENALTESPTVPTTTGLSEDVSNGDYYDYSYEYDYHEEDDIGDQDNCSPPVNGMATRSFLDVYAVTCDKGFTLNNVDNNHQYKCENGKLLNDFNMEANCMENKCVLSTELLSNMDVFGNRSRNEVFLSEDSWFDPGRRLLFNCKTKNHEPVNRTFQCREGQWIAADKDPSWLMVIDNINSSCRPAECNRCVFGDCTKDGICNCHQGATGKDCATPVCHGDCKKNRGRCVRPNICICSTSRYGDNCEKVGCTLPQERGHLSFKKAGLPATFEVGATLSNGRITCPDDFLPSTNKDLLCNEGGKWSEDVSCIPGANYEIEVTIGTGRWGGSWNTLNVLFINERGQTTPRFPIQSTLYQGQTYSADIRTHYIGEIQRLQFTLSGKSFDSLHLKHVSFKVIRGGQVEEYAIQGERWILKVQATFNVDPGCPPPSTNGKLLKPKKRYIEGDKISPNDVQCEPGYILLSTVTCLHNVKWSAPCENESAVSNYSLTFSGNRGTKNKITVVLHGTEGSTEELVLKDHGVPTGVTFSRLWTLRSIGEINEIEVNVGDSFRMGIKYLQLIDHKTNKSYISFYDGDIRGRITLQVDDLLWPTCKGRSFLPGRSGYQTKTNPGKYYRVSGDESCRDMCRRDDTCTAVVLRNVVTGKDCYLFNTNSLPDFVLGWTVSGYKIEFRVCS